jgi:predicted membrane protein
MLVAYLVWALIAWLLLYLFTGKKALTFKRAYSVTLYSTTLFFVLECISMFLPFVRGNFVQLIIFGLFLYYMTRTEIELEKHEHTPGTPAEHIVEDDDKNNGVI